MQSLPESLDWVLRGGHVRLLPGLLAMAIGGAIYGSVMGAFGGFASDRLVQILFVAIKVPMLLLVTTALALPSFFVINVLCGLRNDFSEALRAVMTTQTSVGIILASLAPFTVVWYLSTKDYHEATAFNALMFAMASIAAQWVLRQRYAPLVARNRTHLWMIRVWIIVYGFVGIQMGWVLRPFIGQPGVPVTFLRDKLGGNAYVVVAETLWQALRG
jgi:hypothetical protein